MLLVLAFLFAMPQFTFFMLATAYVASGPYLLLMGERSQALAPMLGPSQADGHAAAAAQGPFSRRCGPRHGRFVRESAASRFTERDERRLPRLTVLQRAA